MERLTQRGHALAHLVGRRVRLTGDHPHAGEAGRVTDVQRPSIGVIGSGVIVELEHCPHGTGSCYVFERRHIRAIGERD
jgi:hypothetical protein